MQMTCQTQYTQIIICLLSVKIVPKTVLSMLACCHDNTQRLTDRSKCSIGFSVTNYNGNVVYTDKWMCYKQGNFLHSVTLNFGAIRTSYQIRALPWHTVSYNRTWFVFQSLWCTAKDISCQSVPSEQNSQTRHLNVTVSLCLPSLLSFGRFVTIVQPSR